MQTASTSEIKNELTNIPSKELLDLCMKLVRYKKENKELLSYLLFHSHNISSYAEEIKKEMDEQFSQINTSSLYFVRKSLRRILRTTNKFIKYTSSKETEVDLLIYFCHKIKTCGIKIQKSSALKNLYNNVIKKAKAVADTLHDDLQYDYNKALDQLTL